MVQYVITPWRDRLELLSVRQAFYPPTESDETTARCRNAVARVSVWVQRGNCPHLIESTALLVSAILNDSLENSAYAMRAAYSAAFCRFVTGLLDGYQDKRHKLSMYSIAKNIRLPATFVELRHQCTHEELPSLPKLRAAAEKSLQWIWENYWKDLEDPSLLTVETQDCRAVVQEYLSWRASSHRQDPEQRRRFAKRVSKWDVKQIADTIMEMNGTDPKVAGILLQSTKLAMDLLRGDEDLILLESFEGDDQPVEEDRAMSLDEIRAEMARDREALEEDQGDKQFVEEGRMRTLDDIRAEMAKVREALEEDQDEEIPDAENEESIGESNEDSNKKESEDSEEEEEDEEGAEEEDVGTGWQKWKGPWISKPIGVV